MEHLPADMVLQSRVIRVVPLKGARAGIQGGWCRFFVARDGPPRGLSAYLRVRRYHR